MTILRVFALLGVALLTLPLLSPFAPTALADPAATPGSLRDDFDVDSVASGIWTRRAGDNSTLVFQDGLAYLNLTSGIAQSGVYIPVDGVAPNASIEARVKLNTIYRFGISFKDTSDESVNQYHGVDLEVLDFGNCICHETSGGGWNIHMLGAKLQTGQWYTIRLTLTPANNGALATIRNAAGTVIQSGQVSNLPFTPAQIREVGLAVWRDTTTNLLPSTTIDHVEITGLTTGAPRDLQVTRGPAAWDASLSWNAPEGAVDEYRIYRAPVGGTPELVGLNAATVRTFYDPVPDCAESYVYAVRAFSGFGESVAATFTSEPHPILLLLCLLRNHDEFYWGGDLEYKDGDGDPDRPQPTSLGELDEHEQLVPSEFPVYFAALPAKLECCRKVVFDANTLRPSTPAMKLDPVEQFDGILSGKAASVLNKTLGQFTFKAAFDGLRYEDQPFVHPAFGDAGTLIGNTGLSFGIDSAQGPEVIAKAESGGHFYADPATKTLRRSGLDHVIVRLPEIPGPRLPPINLPYKAAKEEIKIPHTPFSLKFGGEVALKLEFTTSFDAELGAHVAPDTLRPTLGIIGVGTGLKAGGDLELGAWIIVGGNVKGKVKGEGGIFAEVIAPFNEGLPAGEEFYSVVSGISYANVGSPVFTLFAKPVLLEFDVQACLDYGLGDKCDGVPWKPIDLDGAALVFGEATVKGNGVAISQNDPPGVASSAGASEVTFDAARQDLVFDVMGPAGAVGSVTITRPVAYVLPNGSYVVDDWTVTLPNVAVGEGVSTLYVDTMATQQQIQMATRELGIDLAEASAQVNARIDANGDGLADLVVGSTPANSRDPASVTLAIDTPRVYAGELLGWTAHVGNVATGTLATDGRVIFLANGTEVARADVIDGVAIAHVALPAAVVGLAELGARYEGPTLGAAAATLLREVDERAPILVPTTPVPLSAVTNLSGPLSIAFEAPGIADLDLATGEIRIDGGPWMPAPTLGIDLDVSALADGFHTVDVRVLDVNGLEGNASSAFAMDIAPPYVTATVAPLQVGGRVEVGFAASEPVIARVTLFDPVRNETYAGVSDVFTTEGAARLWNVPAGAYVVTVDFVDTARHPSKQDLGVVVVEGAL